MNETTTNAREFIARVGAKEARTWSEDSILGDGHDATTHPLAAEVLRLTEPCEVCYEPRGSVFACLGGCEHTFAAPGVAGR